jgi:hypothetical protein
MSKLGLGFVLVLTFAVAIGAGVADQRIDAWVTRDRTTLDNLLETHRSLTLAIANWRGAEASGLVPGQSVEFWTRRSTQLNTEIESDLTNLSTSTSSPEARSHYEAATAALGAVAGLTQKAHEDLANNDPALAANLTFADAADSNQRLDAELAAAHAADVGALTNELATFRQWQLVLFPATLALLLILTLPWLRVRPAEPALMITKPATGESILSLRTPSTPTPAPAPVPAPPPTAPVVTTAADIRPSLEDAADICVDLARVLDSRDVQPLLERAANVLAAKGLVLWIADGGGGLRPSMAHGYSDKVLRRLAPLSADADNATSLAYRSLRPQVVSSPISGGSGAIAVPLVAATGCVGVLSAEVRQADRASETLALARLFAAQLATVIAPAAEFPSEGAAQA